MFNTIKKRVRAFLSAVLAGAVLFGTTPMQIPVYAENDNNNTVVTNVFSDDYTPVNVAILMDTSLSIDSADPKQGDSPRTSRIAARRFITRLNSYGNRVSIFKYSTKDQIKRLSDLTELDDLDNVLDLYDTITNKTEPDGGWTYMLDAVKQAADYLQENRRENTKNVIIIFTDGAENGMIDAENYSDKASMTKGINNAIDDVLGGNRADDLIIYSVGYDYLDEYGSHSIEENGFGAQILEELAKRTGGAFYPASEGLSSILQKFDEALGRLNFSDPKNVDEYKGDGKKHDTQFSIGPSVLNASIIIDCADYAALSKAKISLNYNDGTDDTYKNIKLEDRKKNSQGDIWRTDDTITMLQPKPGNWTLTIEGLTCDSNVSIKLFNGYEVESRTTLDLLRNGTSASIDEAQAGDIIKLNTKLYARDQEIPNTDLYTDPTLKARAYFTSEPPLENNFVRNHTIDESLDKLGTDFIPMNASSSGFELSEKAIDWVGTGYVSVFVYSSELDIRCFDCYAVTVGGAKELNIIDPVPKQTFTTSSEPVKIKGLTSKCSPSNADVSVDLTASCYDSQICDVSFDKADDSLTITPLAIGTTQIRLVYTSQLDPSVTAEMLIDVEVGNSKPVFSLPDGEKHKDLPVMGEATIEGISKYVSDPDGDSIDISAKVRSEDAGFISAEYDAGTDVLTISGLAYTDQPLNIVISATDGTDTASDSVTVTMIDDPDPFRLVLRKSDEKFTLKTGEEKVIKNFHECIRGTHDEPVQVITDSADAEAVEITYDEKSDSLIIKAKQKTSGVLLSVKGFDGKRTTTELTINVKVKKPANVKAILGIIAGVIAAAIAAIAASSAIKKSKYRVNLTIKKLTVKTGGKVYEMTGINPPNIMELFQSSKTVTLADLIDSLTSDSTWFSPDKAAAISAAFDQGDVNAAANSLVFYGCKPVSGCAVKTAGQHKDLDAFDRGRGVNFEYAITDQNGDIMNVKLYDGDKEVISFMFYFE